MSFTKGKRPAARGPLAKIAMSRANSFNYSESVADDEEIVFKIDGVLAIQGFKHPDFDKKQFRVYEYEPSSKGHPSRRSWTTTVHVLRDGVVIKKFFSFRCGMALEGIKRINQFESVTNKPSAAKKALKERSDIL